MIFKFTRDTKWFKEGDEVRVSTEDTFTSKDGVTHFEARFGVNTEWVSDRDGSFKIGLVCM